MKTLSVEEKEFLAKIFFDRLKIGGISVDEWKRELHLIGVLMDKLDIQEIYERVARRICDETTQKSVEFLKVRGEL